MSAPPSLCPPASYAKFQIFDDCAESAFGKKVIFSSNFITYIVGTVWM